jgi:chromatin structure-remodeling complex subunit RSC1/2
MDLFDGPPQRIRKLPSPIKHLLREDAKATDDLPKPTWGSPNAPPIVGAVHRRPREAHVSSATFLSLEPPLLHQIPDNSGLAAYYVERPGQLCGSMVPSCLRPEAGTP